MYNRFKSTSVPLIYNIIKELTGDENLRLRW